MSGPDAPAAGFPRVSGVMPAFGRPAETARALASMLAEPVSEAIVVDDASDPPFIPPPELAADPRLRVIRHESNRGAGAARATGVEAARGELVAFLDNDDAWCPGKLAVQVALWRERGSPPWVAVACGWRWVEGGEPRAALMPRAAAGIDAFASGIWYCPGSTALVPRTAFKIVGAFDAGLGRLEDLDWFLRFAREGGSLAVAPIVGSLITRGRNARLAPVRAARDRLIARHGGGGEIAPGGVEPLAGIAARRLRAYLALEVAAAARNEGRWDVTLAELARSLTLAPRLRFHLDAWWAQA